jgi:hypothetical protein
MTLAVEFTGWRDVRCQRNELRLGWVTLWWSPGSVSNEVARLRSVLELAEMELRATRH